MTGRRGPSGPLLTFAQLLAQGTSAGNSKITELGEPTAPTDAARLGDLPAALGPFGWYNVSAVGPGLAVRAGLSAALTPSPFVIENGNTLVLPAGVYFSAFFARASMGGGAPNGYTIQQVIAPPIPAISQLGIFSRGAPGAAEEIEAISFPALYPSAAERRLYIEYTATPAALSLSGAYLCVTRLGDVP